MATDFSRDPRKFDFNSLTEQEQQFATLKALAIAEELSDRGYHATYLLLVAQIIVDMIELRIA
jgi:hypothetical protein